MSEDFWGYRPSGPRLTPECRQWAEEHLGDFVGPENEARLIGDGQISVHEDTATTVLVMGGNQSGKSVCSIIELIIICTGYIPITLEKIYPREKILCHKLKIVEGRLLCGTADIISNTILPAFRRWVPKKALVDGSWKKSWNGGERKLTLVAENGVPITIEVKTYKQDVQDHGGPRRDFLFFDELPPLDIYRENLHRLQAAPYPKIFIAATPTRGIASWIYQDLVSKAITENKGSVRLHKLSSLTNPQTNLKWLTELVKAYNGEEAIKMRLFGDFISFSGFVYADIFKRSLHVIEPFEITRDFLVVRGLDPHWEKPAVCVEAAIDPYGKVFICGATWKKTNVEGIKRELAQRAKEYRMGITVVDCSLNVKSTLGGNVSVIDELRTGDDGIRMLRPSDKAPGSIDRDIRKIRRYLEDGKLFIFNTYENQPLITAMETLERDMKESWRGKDLIKEQNQDAHACLRYIFQLPLNYFSHSDDDIFFYVRAVQ